MVGTQEDYQDSHSKIPTTVGTQEDNSTLGFLNATSATKIGGLMLSPNLSETQDQKISSSGLTRSLPTQKAQCAMTEKVQVGGAVDKRSPDDRQQPDVIVVDC